jgi:hypothetical protein
LVFYGEKDSEGYKSLEDFAKIEDIRKLAYAFSNS